ncbi:DUF4349 domain-containing protein [Sphingomonas echinoides]|uniref:DUF4349 domain-containing protein n=1 Tax=Sphingomonas echinoides TaxID=59803 RepID=UPI003F4B7AC1
MARAHLTIIMALMLMGCSKAAGPASVESDEAAKSNAQTARTTEQIAYTYSFGFKLPGNRIATVQAQHMALCEQLGQRCHVVSMEQSGDQRSAGANMEFAVDAGTAKPFGDALVKAVEREGGAVSNRTIQGENLTKQIIDVDARLRGRQALADRLLGIVKTHQGSISDLVAAEKALADVQQDIDTARAELTAARSRVALSTVQISYSGSAGLGGFTTPIADSFSSFGAVAGMSLAALLSLVAALLPWFIPIVGILVLVRWWRRRGKMEE